MCMGCSAPGWPQASPPHRCPHNARAFRGQPTFKQHQAVAKIIKEDIQQWHGFTLVTKAAADEQAA